MADREALEALAEWCERFSPIVGIDDATGPEGLLLDITGTAHFFHDEASLARQVIDQFARWGLTVRLAIADTPGAARAVARYCSGQPAVGSVQWAVDSVQDVQGQLRILPRTHSPARKGGVSNVDSVKTPPSRAGLLSSRTAKPSLHKPLAAHCPPPTAHCTLVIVPPGQTAAVLGPLPVAALRLPDETVEALRSLGIDRIGHLEALPRSELLSRFGPALLGRLDQALGRAAEIIPAHRPPPKFAAERTLEYPTTRRATVELVLEQLIAQVAAKLARCGQGAMRLACRLEVQAGPPVEVSVGLFRATVSSRHLLDLVRMQLERLRLSSPVAAVHVAAAATAPLEYRQQEMFSEDPPRASPRHLAGLVDRLSSRLGSRSVVRARLAPDAQPELAWRSRPLVQSAAGKRFRRRDAWQPVPADLPPRPLRLLRRPLALRATAIMPDGPPLGFQLRGRQHRIAKTWGPERIETGWWRNRPVGRDYYRVETTTGRRYWVFRRLRDGRWFMHGTFE